MVSVNATSASGSRAVFHGHITAQDPSGGAEPGPHTSREGAYHRRSQPQLWPAAGFCQRSQVTPAKCWSIGYVSLHVIYSEFAIGTGCVFYLSVADDL